MSFKMPSAEDFAKKLNQMEDKTFDSIYRELIIEMDEDTINEALQSFSKKLFETSNYKIDDSQPIGTPIFIRKPQTKQQAYIFSLKESLHERKDNKIIQSNKLINKTKIKVKEAA